MSSDTDDSQQAISNRLTIIFGILATLLAVASVLTGIFRCHLARRSPTIGWDVERQTMIADEKRASLTSVGYVDCCYQTLGIGSVPENPVSLPPPAYSPTRLCWGGSWDPWASQGLINYSRVPWGEQQVEEGHGRPQESQGSGQRMWEMGLA